MDLMTFKAFKNEEIPVWHLNHNVITSTLDDIDLHFLLLTDFSGEYFYGLFIEQNEPFELSRRYSNLAEFIICEIADGRELSADDLNKIHLFSPDANEAIIQLSVMPNFESSYYPTQQELLLRAREPDEMNGRSYIRAGNKNELLHL